MSHPSATEEDAAEFDIGRELGEDEDFVGRILFQKAVHQVFVGQSSAKPS